MNRAPRGLFWRLYATLMASLFLVAVLSAAIFHFTASRQTRPAEGLQARVVSALLPPSGAPAAETEAAVRRLSSTLDGRVTLRGADGRVVAEAEHGQALSPAAGSGGPSRPHAHLVRRIRLSDGRRLEVRVPARHGIQGGHVLAVLLSIAAAVGLGAYPVVSRLTRRLERLRGSVEAWGGGELDRRADSTGGDEVAAVAASFNAAADRVQSLLAAHRALLAHASHELRSPLARLRMAAEMYAADPRPDLKSTIDAEVAELDALVDEILLASRLDHGGDMGARESVDLLALAAEEVARAGVELRTVENGAAPFEVLGSPRLLRRMIRNLIQNAQQHGRPPVEVELGRIGGQGGVTLCVHDRGPGVPEAERDRVFAPFYRPAGRPEAEGSWGLGLSLVRQIAERHGGAVTCAPRPGGGTIFVVELPVGPATPAA